MDITDQESRDLPWPLLGHSALIRHQAEHFRACVAGDDPVLLVGEKGTGKQVVARAIHDRSRNARGPFASVKAPNRLGGSDAATAFLRDLVGPDAEAVARGEPRGWIRAATGGTLFLRGLDDLHVTARALLASVLVALRRGDDQRAGRSAVRLMGSARAFSEEPEVLTALFATTRVVRIDLPSLRDRLEDVPALAAGIQAQLRADGVSCGPVDPDALHALKAHTWRGNLSEMVRVVQRLAARFPAEPVPQGAVVAALAGDYLGRPDRPGSLSEAVEGHLRHFFALHGDALPPPGLYERVLREVERPLFRLCLAATRGNQVRAAHLLGVSRNTLRKKLHDLELDTNRRAT